MHCYIDTLPPEIVSEVLLNVIESFGDDTRLKWRLPLLSRGVSKWFHHITTHTSSLWRYLYIDQPLHPYLRAYIAHSGTRSLKVNVVYKSELAEEGDWMAIDNALAPVHSRLKSLTIHSPRENRLILKLLQHEMPALELLDLTGEGWTGYKIPTSHFPALRSLKSAEFFDFENIIDLPQELQVLNLRKKERGDVQSPEGLWDSFPRHLRVLQIEHIVWIGMVPPPNIKSHLPCLTDLCFEEFCAERLHSILQCLDAPRLQHLAVRSFNFYGSGVDSADWFKDFPALEHLTWESQPLVPRMDIVLRRCSAMKSLHIILKRSSSSTRGSISRFFEAPANDQTFLPLLQDVVVQGVVIHCLRSLGHVRPRLRRLEIFADGFHLGPGTVLGDEQLG